MEFTLTVPLVSLALSGCSLQDAANAPARDPVAEPAQPPPAANVRRQPRAESTDQRLDRIAAAVRAWRQASDLGTARRHAEAARNLIVGPNGPGYGDADGDGTVAEANAIGLLPGLNGGEALAIPAANECVIRDLLGGSWDDPASRWAILQSKIDAWRPGNNTFPTLPSHAQRIVGWATLTLKSVDLATAKEYAGHAQIHVDASHRALTNC